MRSSDVWTPVPGFRSGRHVPRPECGQEEGCKAHDAREKTWRHLKFFQHGAYLHARTPRALCEQCGVKQRRISPHTLRHAAAMHLLQSGVDLTVIALWLGHEDIATMHMYVEADLATKKAALKRVEVPSLKPYGSRLATVCSPPSRPADFAESRSTTACSRTRSAARTQHSSEIGINPALCGALHSRVNSEVGIRARRLSAPSDGLRPARFQTCAIVAWLYLSFFASRRLVLCVSGFDGGF